MYGPGENLFQASLCIFDFDAQFTIAQTGKISMVHGVATDFKIESLKFANLGGREIPGTAQPVGNDIESGLETRFRQKRCGHVKVSLRAIIEGDHHGWACAAFRESLCNVDPPPIVRP